jgi:hypothetical protein
MRYHMGAEMALPGAKPRGAGVPRRKNSRSAAELPGSLQPPDEKDPNQPLTEQQRSFVNQLVHYKMNQTAAARLAGYNQPGTAANFLMKQPKIKKAIAEERAAYAEASQVTKKKVIDGFLEAIEMAKVMSDPLAMISGWREVGKMCGFYEPTKTKIEVSVNGQVMLQKIEAMSDDELLKLMHESANVLEGEFTEVDTSADAGSE